MDPLSVTASIIAVIQIASVVSTHCMQYVKSAKNTNSLILRLVQELGGLQIVLRTLEQLTERGSSLLQDDGEYDDDEDEKTYLLPTLHKLTQLEYVFEECFRKLEQLERDITPLNQVNLTKKESFFRALHWPLKEAYMRNVMGDINHYIGLFSLALTLDETDNILDIREKTFETNSIVKYLYSKKEEESQREHGEKIIKWLSAPDSSVDYAHALRMKTQNTGSWLIENDQYKEWKRTAGSLLWMYGIAGCGKTVLSSTVVEDLLNHSNLDMKLAVTYFYFKSDDKEKSSSSRMLRSLLKQLFIHGRRTSSVFERLIHDEVQEPSSEQLLSVLRNIVSEFGDVYIVLDALDECHDSEHLFDIFEEIEKWTDSHIHLIFTSRETKDIKEFVESMTMDKFLIKLSAAVVKQDIRMYIRDRLRTDRNLKRWRNHPKVQDEIEQSLVENSDGMFQWVFHQLISLVKCRSPPELRKALRTMPKGLNDTYARILSRISDDDYDVAMRMLNWLLFSQRPLSLEELAELAAMDLNAEPFDDIERFWEPSEVLNICPNLLTTIEEYEDEDQEGEPRIMVRLAHISIREYLLSSDILTGRAARFQINEPNAHASITDCCLMYMRLIKESVSKSADDLPLALYAVENWLFHYEKTPDTATKTHLLALDFFLHRKEGFAKWVSHISGSLPISKLPVLHHDMIGPLPISPLEVVCYHSLLTVLKMMLESDEVDVKNDAVLKSALRAAYLPTLTPRDKAGTAKLLLQYGIKFSGDGKFGTVLNAASYFGLNEFVLSELDQGADVNEKGRYYVSALQAAIVGRHDRHFFDMSHHFWPTRWPRPGYVLEQEEATTIRILLGHGADPNICNDDDGSSLLLSCYNGDLPCVELLLEHGADPNYGLDGKDTLKKSCLAAACRSADIRIVQLLLDHGARVDSPMALCSAVRSKDIDIMRLLLDKGANPNTGRYQDETQLQLACFNEQPKAVELLIQYGADVRSGGGRFGSPLQLASATFGSIETIKILIKNGADVNQRGGAFGTPLHAAAHYGDIEMVEYLISQGADIHAQGVMYHSVLRHALQNAYTDIFILLFKKGADMITRGGRYGETIRETFDAVPIEKPEIWIKTHESNNPKFPSSYLCAVARKGESWQDIDNIVLDDRGSQSDVHPSQWDCILPNDF